MPRTEQYQNPQRLQLIKDLKEQAREKNAPLWKRVAKELSKPRSNRREINVKKIGQETEEGEVVLVPGKVLGNGKLNHPLTIAAFKFTSGAKKEIKKSNSTAMTIRELMKDNPQGSEVKLLG